VELIHKFHRNAVVAFLNDDQRYWSDYLSSYTMTYNTSIGPKGYTPAFLMFGRELLTPGSYPNPTDEDMKYMDFPERVAFTLARVQALVLEEHKQRLLRRAGIDIIPTQFEIGAKVLRFVPRVDNDEQSYKLTRHWIGPYTISRHGKVPQVYYVKDNLGQELSSPINVRNLKPYYDRAALMPELFTVWPTLEDVEEVEDSRDRERIRELPQRRDVAEEMEEPDVGPSVPDGDLVRDKAWVPDKKDLPDMEKLQRRKSGRAQKAQEAVMIPNTPANRKLYAIGHEAYLSDDLKNIILKTRIAGLGERQSALLPADPVEQLGVGAVIGIIFDADSMI
jgi:hypothetical protein